MALFLDAMTSFPTAIFSVLLAMALFYWLLALLGLVDFDADGLTLDVNAEALDDPGALASALMAFGFRDVPISIVVSGIVLVGWTLSCLGGMWLLPILPATLHWPAGAVLGLASLSAALPVTSLLVRPLRGLFVTHAAVRNAAFVGQTCRVLTQSVDESLGRAEITQRGANLNIRVWARTPNTLSRGATARIVAYDQEAARYQIEPEA